MQLRGSARNSWNWLECRVVSLTFTFWMFVVLFSLIGMMRGWAKELLVVFSVILALAFNVLLRQYMPMIKDMQDNDQALFWIRTTILIVLVFFGYQTVALPRFAGKAAREKLQDSILGFVFGFINGYLVVGTIWFYLDQAGYPFSYIQAPDTSTELGMAAINLLQAMPPRLLGEPAIYFAVILSFIFVIVVFI
jgi:uncharacterized membrane protein required for colicin V production